MGHVGGRFGGFLWIESWRRLKHGLENGGSWILIDPSRKPRREGEFRNPPGPETRVYLQHYTGRLYTLQIQTDKIDIVTACVQFI